jgi:hypothetical protein
MVDPCSRLSTSQSLGVKQKYSCFKLIANLKLSFKILGHCKKSLYLWNCLWKFIPRRGVHLESKLGVYWMVSRYWFSKEATQICFINWDLKLKKLKTGNNSHTQGNWTGRVNLKIWVSECDWWGHRNGTKAALIKPTDTSNSSYLLCSTVR